MAPQAGQCRCVAPDKWLDEDYDSLDLGSSAQRTAKLLVKAAVWHRRRHMLLAIRGRAGEAPADAAVAPPPPATPPPAPLALIYEGQRNPDAMADMFFGFGWSSDENEGDYFY